MYKYFNPRSREGSDKRNPDLSTEGFIFQSTLPRRERPKPQNHNLKSLNFNPRSREGSDLVVYQFTTNRNSISIHAPAKGATSSPKAKSSCTVFQSTLPRRERRHAPLKVILGAVNFNPRSREGSDGQ